MIRRILDRFTRRHDPSTTPFPPQPESESDWAPGDLARCIGPVGVWRVLPTGGPVDGPRRGQLLRVSNVTVEHGFCWLGFNEYGSPGYRYSAGYFRKLRPCSSDFERQIRETAPVAPVQPRRIPELVP